MGEVIIAPDIRELEDGSVIFLAGPIQGAEDWQTDAIQLLQSMTYAHIASPRQPIRHEGDFTREMFVRQARWEHRYLAEAARKGVILFWLAHEAIHFHHRAFAQTSRFELGWQMARHIYSGARVVVGIEAGKFSGEDYIRLTLGDQAPNIPILDSLEEACEMAAKLAA